MCRVCAVLQVTAIHSAVAPLLERQPGARHSHFHAATTVMAVRWQQLAIAVGLASSLAGPASCLTASAQAGSSRKGWRSAWLHDSRPRLSLLLRRSSLTAKSQPAVAEQVQHTARRQGRAVLQPVMCDAWSVVLVRLLSELAVCTLQEGAHQAPCLELRHWPAAAHWDGTASPRPVPSCQFLQPAVALAM